MEQETLTTEQHILDAAYSCFVKYGFNRTSMSDIADAAELSRTALYNHFKNKKIIFKAVCLRLNQQVLSDVKAAMSIKEISLEKLQAVISARLSWAFTLLHDSEHGRELIDEKNKICGEIGAEVNQEFQKYIASLLRDANKHGLLNLKAQKTRPDFAAELLIDSAFGVVHEEADETKARNKLDQLVAIFWAGLK